MSRRILAQVTAPAAFIGLLLFVACLTSAWYINNLQTNLANALQQNVASSQISRQLEVTARQLRFNCFLYLVRANPQTLEEVNKDEATFEHWLHKASKSSQGSVDEKLIADIKQAYSEYRQHFDALRAQALAGHPPDDVLLLARASPVEHIVEPCRRLLEEHDDRALATAEQSEQISRYLRLAMLMLGLAGPLGGILSGYGIARGLSRSIHRLSVRVKDMAQHLDYDVGSVSVTSETDIHDLDGQLERVVRRVEQVAERLQRQQRELLRAEQLSAVGKLAASVAHEIRNPLTSVKMLVGLALRRQKPKPLGEADLHIIHDEVDRVEHTVQHLLDFARLPDAASAAGCDLRAVVMHAADLVRGRAEQQGVELHVPQGQAPVCRRCRSRPDSLRCWSTCSSTRSTPCRTAGGSTSSFWPTRRRRGDAARRRHRPRHSQRDAGPAVHAVRQHQADRHRPGAEHLAAASSRSTAARSACSNRPEGGACFTITLPAQPAEVHYHADAAGH